METQGHDYFRIKRFDHPNNSFLFVKMRKHEIEMNKLNEQKSEVKKTKGITRKSCLHKSEEESNECSDTKTLNMLTRKFSKFPKKKGKNKVQ